MGVSIQIAIFYAWSSCHTTGNKLQKNQRRTRKTNEDRVSLPKLAHIVYDKNFREPNLN